MVFKTKGHCSTIRSDTSCSSTICGEILDTLDHKNKIKTQKNPILLKSLLCG